MTRILVDQDIAPIAGVRAGLPDAWDVEIGLPGAEEDLPAALVEADGMLITSRVPASRAVLEASGLSFIGKLGTGIDNVDLEAAHDCGIPVVYTPGYNALSVAELAMGLLIGAARRFTGGRSLVETDRWRDELTLGTRITGSQVGIIGFGNVGTRFAELLSGFDVDIRYYDPYVTPIDGEIVGASPMDLDSLLATSDFICVMAELTTETRGMIDADAFDRMHDEAILVNTARGPIVDEPALLDAIRNDRIAGAGLDVFATEPLPSDSPLLGFDDVVLMPHAGAMTEADREKTITRLTRSVVALERGEPVAEEFVAVPPAE